MSTALALVGDEIVDGSTLAELAARANREHEMCEQHLLSALPHAIQAGHALFTAHGMLDRGEWEPWLQREFRGSTVLARLYVRLAFYEERLGGQQSIKSARDAITGLPPVCLPGARVPKYDEVTRTKALELVEAGMTHRDVADLLGVGRGAVYHWRHPERTTERNRRASAARKAAQARKRDAAIKRAVRKAGAATAEAWAMAERFQDVIAQAHDETQDSEARAALARAGEHYRKMRDEIVRALGVQ